MRSSQIGLSCAPTVGDLFSSIEELFCKLGVSAPACELRPYGAGAATPYIFGEQDDEWCWVQILEWRSPLDDNFGCKFSCSVESRGSDKFAALVMFAVMRDFGEGAYDDAGYIDAGREMTAGLMHDLLLEKFFPGKGVWLGD